MLGNKGWLKIVGKPNPKMESSHWHDDVLEIYFTLLYQVTKPSMKSMSPSVSTNQQVTDFNQSYTNSSATSAWLHCNKRCLRQAKISCETDEHQQVQGQCRETSYKATTITINLIQWLNEQSNNQIAHTQTTHTKHNRYTHRYMNTKRHAYTIQHNMHGVKCRYIRYMLVENSIPITYPTCYFFLPFPPVFPNWKKKLPPARACSQRHRLPQVMQGDVPTKHHLVTYYWGLLPARPNHLLEWAWPTVQNKNMCEMTKQIAAGHGHIKMYVGTMSWSSVSNMVWTISLLPNTLKSNHLDALISDISDGSVAWTLKKNLMNSPC